MSEPAAILATFSDWRTVKGRKCLQLIFEVPVEQTQDVLTKLGAPMPHEDRWCAIGLYVKPPQEKAEPKDRRKFSELPLSQQVALRCRDKQFQDWLVEIGCVEDPSEDWAADFVRAHCDVKSRADIEGNQYATERWHLMESNYQQYLTDQQFAGSLR